MFNYGEYYNDTDYSEYVEPVPGIVLAFIVCSVVTFLLYASFSTWEVVNMQVRNAHWQLNVFEREDYKDWVCHTRTESGRKYDSLKGEYVTVIREYQDCGWETKTRTTNQWESSGDYPTPPKWPEYVIAPGRYESRDVLYSITLSNDGKLYYFFTKSDSDYNNLPPKTKVKVSLNFFDSIIRIDLI